MSCNFGRGLRRDVSMAFLLQDHFNVGLDKLETIGNQRSLGRLHDVGLVISIQYFLLHLSEEDERLLHPCAHLLSEGLPAVLPDVQAVNVGSTTCDIAELNDEVLDGALASVRAAL